MANCSSVLVFYISWSHQKKKREKNQAVIEMPAKDVQSVLKDEGNKTVRNLMSVAG